MCDYKKRLPDKNGGLFCDRVLVFASHGIMIASYFSVKEGKRL